MRGELGVSITPVREALLKLRGEGMVQWSRTAATSCCP